LTNVVDVHVNRLRKKVDQGFGEPLIHTIRGVGMSSGRHNHRFGFQTIGTRLTAWGAGITFLICLLICGALYGGVWYSLNREVDSFLEGEVREFLVSSRNIGSTTPRPRNSSACIWQQDQDRPHVSRPRRPGPSTTD
jgi:hypothetical protein